MGIEPTTETLQVFLAKALVHASPNFPLLRLQRSSHIGFFYFKNLLGIPDEKVNPILGGEEDFPNRFPMSTTFTR